jgi:hypothetical protein
MTGRTFHDNFLNASQRPKAKMGKMEKSFFNFKAIHPDWKCASSGQNLLDRMQQYRSEQAHAIARERQHHIAAAVRQLATLREVELQNNEIDMSKLNLDPNQINEQYVRVDHDLNHSNTSDEPREEFTDDINYDNVEPFEEFKEEKCYPRVQFKDLPSTSRQSASRILNKSNLVLRYDDVGLSAELNGLLNRSTLDPSVSLLAPGNFSQSLSPVEQVQSYIAEEGNDTREQILQRQVRHFPSF